MPKITEWGPTTWAFFHTIVEGIKVEYYEQVHRELFIHIRNICQYLHCPECSAHASRYLKSIRSSQIKTHNDFKMVMYQFHNEVNRRKKKAIFDEKELNIYENKKISQTFNAFSQYYCKTGNLQQISQSFQRKLIIKDFINWLSKNREAFGNI